MKPSKKRMASRLLAVMMSAAMAASAVAPITAFAAPAADVSSVSVEAEAKELSAAADSGMVMEENDEAVSNGFNAGEVVELPELNQENLAGIMEERMAAVKTDATVIPMLWQGFLEQKIQVGDVTRTAKLYVPKDTPQGTSFILLNLPEGQTDTVNWLQQSGWIKVADTLKLCLFCLEPGEGGWGTAEEEMAYIEAGYKAERTGVYLMPGPSLYIVGYGKVGSDLQKIAMANPLSVAAAAFVDANEIDDAYLKEMAEKSFDTETKKYGVMYKDVPVPVMLFNSSEKLVDYWKGVNKATEASVNSSGNTTIWRQAEKSEITPEGLISMVISTTGDANLVSIGTLFGSYYRYGGGPRSNMLAVKVNYEDRGVDFVRFTDSNGIEREYIAYVPKEVKEAGKPAPLVVAYHGAQTSMRNFFENTLYYRLADSYGFMVVFPESTLIPVAPALTGGVTKAYRPLWQLENPDMIKTEEVYADELLDNVIANYKVDENRIYCTGHSMGCMMTNYLGTSKVSDRFAACGATSGPLNGEAAYDYKEAVPMFLTMAEYDMWSYDISKDDSPVSKALDNWLIRNGLATKETASEVRNNPDKTETIGRFNTSTWRAKDSDGKIDAVRYSWITAKDHVNIPLENEVMWSAWFSLWVKGENGGRYYNGLPYNVPAEAPTEPATEAPTEPATEAPTEAPTEPATEAPTEPATEAPTEPATEAPTEPATEAPTEPATEAPTEAPTEPATETPTEPATEAPTEPATEPSTEEPTEPSTEEPVDPENPIDAFVEGLYATCLGRTAKADEIKAWADLLKDKKNTGAKTAHGFFFSEEYKNNNKTNEEYVTDLYNTLMGRKPDKSGLDAWVSCLEKGTSREKVFAGFVNSPEFKAICDEHGIEAGSYKSNRIADVNPDVTAFVARLYTEALGRPFEVDGLEAWTALLLDKKTDGEKTAYGFFCSDEFVNRKLSDEEFLKAMYKAMFDREPDEGGMNDWLKVLSEGASRKAVVKGFARSPEFEALCSSFGIVAKLPEAK